MENFDKMRITIQERSDGDGMENSHFTETNKNQDSIKYASPDVKYSKNFIPVPGKRKEPKFVPYEPYKAAVSPIVPTARKLEDIATHVVIDSQKVSSLASSVIRINSCKEPCVSNDQSILTEQNVHGNINTECSQKCAKKIIELEEKINQLEQEKKDLESQFKIQTDVNADLKKMLVASLGDDLHLKVQYMTEDKARLGMNVLQYSAELAEKNEEIKKLSVQCDVWKSKFEASSVMVDELARWKVALSQKLGQISFAVDSLLKEHKIISNELYNAYKVLKNTQAAFNPSSHNVTKNDHKPQSLIQLAKEIQNLSIAMQERLLGRSSPKISTLFHNNEITQLTPAEQAAFQVLKDVDNLPSLINTKSHGNLHYGPGETACQVLPHNCSKDTTVNCCKHCSGEIKVL